MSWITLRAWKKWISFCARNYIICRIRQHSTAVKMASQFSDRRHALAFNSKVNNISRVTKTRITQDCLSLLRKNRGLGSKMRWSHKSSYTKTTIRNVEINRMSSITKYCVFSSKLKIKGKRTWSWQKVYSKKPKSLRQIKSFRICVTTWITMNTQMIKRWPQAQLISALCMNSTAAQWPRSSKALQIPQKCKLSKLRSS